MTAEPTIQTLPFAGGATVTVPNDIHLMTPFVLREQGDWFETEIQFVRRMLRTGMRVVDIGANYGLYTITCALAVGENGRVWSYEPASLPHSCLAQSLVTNHLENVSLSKKAVSDHEGTARLGIASNAELNSLNEVGLAGETVPLTTLDREAEAWDRPIDFVKLDAEGEEVRILAGARSFFARHTPLVMFEYKHGNTVNDGLLRAITDLGLKVYRHLPGPNVLVPFAASESPDGFLLNVFGCAPDRARRLAEEGLLVEDGLDLPAIDVKNAESTMDAWFGKRPWATPFQAAGLCICALPDTVAYYASLAEILRGENPDLNADERVARLRRGFANLLLALKSQANASRLLSASRVAMDLGERVASVLFLEEAQRVLSTNANGLGAALPEAFLPPHRRHDDLALGVQSPVAALFAMIDEPLVERGAFSTYFASAHMQPLLRRLAQNPLCSPSMNRRIEATRHAFAW